jgi:hypothetical protein
VLKLHQPGAELLGWRSPARTRRSFIGSEAAVEQRQRGEEPNGVEPLPLRRGTSGSPGWSEPRARQLCSHDSDVGTCSQSSRRPASSSGRHQTSPASGTP